MRRDPILHILTSDEIIVRPDFTERAIEVIHAAGRHGIFHLRSRTLAGREYVALAHHLLEACQLAGGRLVINDRVDVALVTGADGVQLGRGALTPIDVRRIAPTVQIGISVHSVVEVKDEALRSTRAGWVIAGPIFESASHPGFSGHGLPFLREVVAAAGVPVIGVGGVTPERVAPVLGTGAGGAAVISGIWGASDPKRAVLRYLSAYADWAGRGDDDSHGERTGADPPAGDDAGHPVG